MSYALASTCTSLHIEYELLRKGNQMGNFNVLLTPCLTVLDAVAHI